MKTDGQSKNGRDTSYMAGIQEVTDIQALANAIARGPDKWIPVLGNGISYDVLEQGEEKSLMKREKIISEMAEKVVEDKSMSKKDITRLYNAAQDKDFDMLCDILFGDIWDEAGFLEEYRERQIKRRQEYADRISKVDVINLDFVKQDIKNKTGKYAKVDLTKIMDLFPHIIMTTCQDETIEAYMEYEKSIPVRENVCTPHSLITSPKWERRLELLSEEKYKDLENDSCMLIKVCGNVREPNRMLFSKRDFETYYPQSAGDSIKETPTMHFFERIFRGWNLLFIGFEIIEVNERQYNKRPKLPPGLCELLEQAASSGKRYLLPVEKADSIQRFIDELTERVKEIEITGEENKSFQDIKLNSDTIYHQFCDLYIRRPFLSISPKEQEVLKTEILGIQDGNKIARSWSKKSIELLAISANNLADFYDLSKVFHQALSTVPRDGGISQEIFLEKVTESIIKDRLSDKSYCLYRLLLEYKEGFPSSFLELLAADDNQLKDLKQSVIQLANTGICTREHQRKNIYKRMKYADRIMMTAGSNPKPDQKKFEIAIQEMGSQFHESYYYLSNVLTDDEDHEKADREVNVKYENMCKRLCEILESKSDGYDHFRSLLETEMPVILDQLKKFDQNNLKWKPQLIYYLFKESRLVPVSRENSGNTTVADINIQLEGILKQLDDFIKRDGDCQELLYRKMMVLQAMAILGSQSYEESVQKSALTKCNEAEKVYIKLDGKGTVKEEIFEQEVQNYFLMIRIYGRRCSIWEIARCAKKLGSCEEQESLLNGMNVHLDAVKCFIEEREKMYGGRHEEMKAQLAHLYGEYYFKKSQYYWENRRYTAGAGKDCDIEKFCYNESEKAYDSALEYYNKYPHQYTLQRADVLRDKADLLFRKSKSSKSNEDKMPSGLYYQLLYKAYELYRSCADLHGIADVLQSMGNAENYDIFEEEKEMGKRSCFCFYNASKKLYEQLGDEWSRCVVEAFQIGAEKKRQRAYEIKFENVE